MDQGLILESTFLVDLEREAAREREGPAFAMLARHEDERLCVSLVTAGELACGPRLEERGPGLDVRGY